MSGFKPEQIEKAKDMIAKMRDLIDTVASEDFRATGKEDPSFKSFIQYVMFAYSGHCLKDLVGSHMLRMIFEDTLFQDESLERRYL